VQGFRVPAITARKARTTVELRDGQSFAIAGLIRRDFNDSLRGMPGVSRVPIFGALMRSTSFQNNETEVIIIVTVNRANPTTLDRLKTPIEGFRAPSEPELFINGATEKPQAALEPQGDPIGEIISTASLD
jgi:pilus assembly protein CpaC